MRSRGSFILLVMIPIAYACESIVDPELDSRAVQFPPPAVYRTWWNIVQSCSGKSRNFDDVTWYVVQNSDFVQLKGKNVGAYWTSAGNSIVLAGNGALEGDSFVTKCCTRFSARMGIQERISWNDAGAR